MSNENLSASLEDYLEAIFQICIDHGEARVKEIAQRLDVRAASVTGALGLLAEKGLINYEPYGRVTLTSHGKMVGEDVVRRHESLKEFFVKVLLVEPAEAESTACRMEHVVSREILDKFVGFMEFVELCPRAGEKWIKGFELFCQQKNTDNECEVCLAQCLQDLKEKKNVDENEQQSVTTLDQLLPGQVGRVIAIPCKTVIGRRLLKMGIDEGSFVHIEGETSLGDYIDVKIKGYRLSLRKKEAAVVRVSEY
jgi:DtxR family Mn-dependent transcriptional regulator